MRTRPGPRRSRRFTQEDINAIRARQARGRLAKCIGCGCDDLHACFGGCAWLIVDRRAGLGVCSSCPGEIRRFGGHLKARAS